MPPRDYRIARVALSVSCVFACSLGGAKAPWGGAPSASPVERADVHTLNPDYERTRSQVWVRKVDRPTRAALDYAAYHANFMIADPEPEAAVPEGRPADTAKPFAGKIERSTLTADIAKVPLSAAERQNALAFAPLSEFLQAHQVAGAGAFAEVGAAVHDEKWGLSLPAGSAGQALSELYLHTPGTGAPELWAKIEFQPWFHAFASSPDQDGDGYRELYGRVRADSVSEAVLTAIQGDYSNVVLAPAEVKAWANQLSSYWYPSFNTDLMPVSAAFPDEQTEENIKGELKGARFANPAIVLRGKPQGKPTYNVFLIGSEPTGEVPVPASTPSLRLSKSKPAPNPEPIARALENELQQ
ncbi:MAG: hypothetical protein ABIQ16_28790, partial [Polyangiaceae bacterium]